MDALKFFEGLPCRRCDSTRRYISTGGCVDCQRAKAAGKILPPLPPKKTMPPDDEQTPGIIIVKQPGRCRHGRQLRDYCRECEVSWRSQPRNLPATAAREQVPHGIIASLESDSHVN
jgi:hypothetical protein